MGNATAPTWAAVNIQSTDAAGLADFWAKTLHRPVLFGITADTVILDVPEGEAGIQMVFHQVDAKPVGNAGYRATLQTESHDEEVSRLKSLGASVVEAAVHGPLQLTVLTDPDGNPFNLATIHA